MAGAKHTWFGDLPVVSFCTLTSLWLRAKAKHWLFTKWVPSWQCAILLYRKSESGVFLCRQTWQSQSTACWHCQHNLLNPFSLISKFKFRFILPQLPHCYWNNQWACGQQEWSVPLNFKANISIILYHFYTMQAGKHKNIWPHGSYRLHAEAKSRWPFGSITDSDILWCLCITASNT